MITFKMEEDDFLEMLYERVEYWCDGSGEVYEAFCDYYENLVYNGYFEEVEQTVQEIVDNDYVNYISVCRGKEELKKYYGIEPDDERVLWNHKNRIYLVQV